MKAIVSQHLVASVHSLSIAASKDDITPVITQIAITREGDALRAMTTDRFMVLAGLYDEVEFEDWAEGDTILVDPTALKRAIDIKKANKSGIFPMVITRDDDTKMSLATLDATTTLALGAVQGNYPPLMKLMVREGQPNGAGTLNLRPDFLARLARVLPPVPRPDRERVWRFDFRTLPDSNKPEPVYAEYSDGLSYKLEALIQPAMDKR